MEGLMLAYWCHMNTNLCVLFGKITELPNPIIAYGNYEKNTIKETKTGFQSTSFVLSDDFCQDLYDKCINTLRLSKTLVTYQITRHMSQKAALLISCTWQDETHNPARDLSTQLNVQLFPKPRVTVTDQSLPVIYLSYTLIKREMWINAYKHHTTKTTILKLHALISSIAVHKRLKRLLVGIILCHILSYAICNNANFNW
jgi:hypothetical protein